ncbi:N-acetylmuramoyl-L-alanine amidase family protein [Anaeromicropila herbilytica]|uniref:MurNAc-LAA domain-containing protein n=1 Tax=Anaeromicropila herbilytica TaxID=2785025 RepID=A0A7R7EJ59_9FIRM|nr:N-acetylmuramoyl-L-alanine amidase [Anaeromicropila herbilytica]BCN29675.1 hypothetical protein bsdtb5_09700 [Anaeromicropila herbilytica]
MNRESLHRMSIKSLIILGITIIISFIFTYHNNGLIQAQSNNIKNNDTINDINIGSFTFSKKNILDQMINQTSDSFEYDDKIKNIDYINIKKIKDPFITISKNGISQDAILTMEDSYMDESLILTFSNDNIDRLSKSITYNTSAKSQTDIIRNIDFYKKNDKKSCIIKLKLDKIYVHTIIQDSKNLYIVLQRPKDVYNKILVLDAGHGGNDIGTASPDMEYYEKDLNLNIVLELKKLLDKEKIKVYYTRLKDQKLYLKQRVNLANNLDADLFISIHCNSSKNKNANGVEVLYNDRRMKDPMDSELLSKICLEKLVNTADRYKRSIVGSNGTYIIGHAKIPVALIEVGYMTNIQDLKFLLQHKNQKLIAKGIYEAIRKAYSYLD